MKMAVWMYFLVFLSIFMATASSNSSRVRQQTYIVHMDGATVTALADALSGTKRWYETIINSLVNVSDQETLEEEEEGPELLYVYDNTITGFAAKLSARQVKKLHQIHGVLSVNPDDMLLGLHTTYSPQFLGLKPGQGLWKPLNLAPTTVIGIIDTGIWPEHASFSDANMPNSGIPSHWKGTCEAGTMFSPKNCNNKLIGARAFYKGYEAIVGRINETSEYRSARDSKGHGTHTASTAAGNAIAGANLFGNARGTARGMRYTSRIASYKACWSSGCTSSDIMAAIDRAVADGVNVLSLSLGGGSQPYYSDSFAIAAFRATQKGVLVSCSAGNSGPFESTVGNTAPWIMTVAASYLDRSFPTTVELGDGQSFIGSSLYSGKPTKWLPLIYGGRAGRRKDAVYCNDGSLSQALVNGKIVLCERGLIGRTQKGEQVKLAGGKGMLLLNSKEQGEEQFADAHILPASSLGASASKAIKGYVMSSKKPTARITFHETVYGNPAPLVAAFSSRGPSSISPDIIKPDITAPGMSILAAWPSTVSPSLLNSDKRRVGFNIISGTSMSCPHVSGLAALIKSMHPNWSPAAIKSAMMTTGYTLNNRNASIVDVSSGSPATPYAMGSGHVDPERASNPGLIYDIGFEDYVNYLCSLNYTSSQIAAVAGRKYSCPKSRTLQAGDLNYPSFSLLFGGGIKNATVTYTRTLTNVGSARCDYSVNVRKPGGVSMSVEPAVLTFVKMGEKLSYKVTFVDLGRTRSSFGELVWVCGGYSVRSPIAVSWQ